MQIQIYIWYTHMHTLFQPSSFLLIIPIAKGCNENKNTQGDGKYSCIEPLFLNPSISSNRIALNHAALVCISIGSWKKPKQMTIALLYDIVYNNVCLHTPEPKWVITYSSLKKGYKKKADK